MLSCCGEVEFVAIMLPHSDPLAVKLKNETDKLNRRRQAASEASKQIVARREAFFDRLALLNAGALTFSVTLVGNLGHSGQHTVLVFTFLLNIPWAFLLIAVAACGLRNFVHQHYQMAEAMSRMAEAEIAYIDVDGEFVSTRTVTYSDSYEAFDRDREIRVNRSNREAWKKTLDRESNKEERFWTILYSSEWTAGISSFLGFLFLVFFATYNL